MCFMEKLFKVLYFSAVHDQFGIIYTLYFYVRKHRAGYVQLVNNNTGTKVPYY